MAERDTTLPESDAGEAADGKPGKRRLTGILILVVLLISGGFGAYLAVTQYQRLVVAATALGMGEAVDAGEDEEETDPDAEDAEGDAAEPTEFGEFMEITGLIVNPAETEGRRYLMVNVAFESPEPAALEEIQSREIVVRDAMIKVLAQRTVAELGSVEGRTAVKAEMLEMVNGFASEGEITRLYFTQYVLQ